MKKKKKKKMKDNKNKNFEYAFLELSWHLICSNWPRYPKFS